MSYNQYFKAKKLYDFHNDGRSPWPRDIQKTFAEINLKKILKMEAEHPEYKEYYDVHS